MEDSWAIFTDDIDEDYMRPPNLLPSSLKDVWGDDRIMLQPEDKPIEQSYDLGAENPFIFSRPESTPQRSFIIPESAPSGPYTIGLQSTFPVNQPETYSYCTVSFRPNRKEVFKFKSSLALKASDYVITEADRGYDIGSLTTLIPRPTARDIKSAHNILRKATQSEIDQIPLKIAKEKKATEVCQQKAAELNLPMQITDTEFQFDGKKLTVYFFARQYVDFRNLVRVLFKIFETRIWMVWYDGNAPVRDVLDHQNKPHAHQNRSKH